MNQPLPEIVEQCLDDLRTISRDAHHPPIIRRVMGEVAELLQAEEEVIRLLKERNAALQAEIKLLAEVMQDKVERLTP